jgi:hypothetical protein
VQVAPAGQSKVQPEVGHECRHEVLHAQLPEALQVSCALSRAPATVVSADEHAVMSPTMTVNEKRRCMLIHSPG